MLPVEQFMRDYFRHTNQVSHVVDAVPGQGHLARSPGSAGDRAVRPSRGGRSPRRPGGDDGHAARDCQRLRGNLTAIMRLVDLANLYDKPIAPGTWEAIRREAPRLPDVLPPEACRHFLSLLAHPARLGPLLRDLHDAGLLERFIPAFAHARGLLQFNQYHKYTVDEHCLRAVEFAADLLQRPRAAGARLSRHRRQAHPAPGPADPRPGQGLSGGPSRGGAADRRADGRAAGPARRTRPRR